MSALAAAIQGLPEWLDPLRLELLLKGLLAVVLGAVVGLEREFAGKPAGLRTNVLICVGAALLADLSIRIGRHGPGMLEADPGRIAAQVVSGIGFLGAGTILKSQGAVHGLTTAATIWVVAAIGLTVGAGEYAAAIGSTGIVAGVLVGLGPVEGWVARRRRTRVAMVRAHHDTEFKVIADVLRAHGYRVTSKHVEETGDERIYQFDMKGSSANIEGISHELMRHRGIRHVSIE